MRALTFSVLKRCRLRLCGCGMQTTVRTLAVAAQPPPPATAAPVSILGDPTLVEVLPSWKEDVEPELRAEALRTMRVLPEFVSETEEAALLEELEPVLKRMRYEFDHWDNAIQGYRETERSVWREPNAAVLERVRRIAATPLTDPVTDPKTNQFTDSGFSWLPHAHILDLASAGHIKPHIDAVRFCGGVIAGVCLLSSAVMRLQHAGAGKEGCVFDALIPRRCLYIMSGVSRYEFTHAVLGGEDSSWRGERLPRRRRVALICRSAPPRQH